MKWINMFDKKPIATCENISDSVLIYDGEYVDVGHFDHETEEFENYGKFLTRENVTHWMPLPEPPKTE